MALYTKPLSWLAPLAAVLAPLATASGQTLRGTVVDSTSRFPVVGAVVEARDSAGVTLSRGLTDAQGAYAIGRPAGVKRLRIVRMGYRPRDIDLAPMFGSEQRVDAGMVIIPTFLERVNAVAAQNCPRRADSQRAFALLEQARAGLLATIVSNESNAPLIKILRYDRLSDGTDHRILKQNVTIDSTAAATSFVSVRSAREFVDSGFVSRERPGGSRSFGGGRNYYGPDATVLLDTSFAESYCFRLRDGRKTAEIGLGFAPARTRRGRVDIDGTLWIDTAAKVVTEISFNYVGAPRTPEVNPGGTISFHTMPNGATFINRWFFRMVDVREETYTSATGSNTKTYSYTRTAGGEVARATFADGQVWQNSLGTARLKVVDKFNDRVTRAVLRLTDTDYIGSPDSTGTVVLRDLLPGPYQVELQDSALVNQQIIMKSVTRFNVDRGQMVIRTVVAPPVHVFYREACQKGWTGEWIEIAAIDGEKHAVQVKWTLGEDIGGRYEHLMASGVTAKDGIFGYCRDKSSTAFLEAHMERLDDPLRSVRTDVPSEPGKKPWTVIVPFRLVWAR